MSARGFWLGILTAYVAIGLFLGFAMRASIPAINITGALYYATTWPAWVSAGTFGTPSPPIPRWCFTFKDAA